MDAVTILFYGNKTLMDSLNNVPQSLWQISGACGVWSVKDIVAHLAAAEHMLLDVLNAQLTGAPMLHLQRMGELGAVVNDVLVGEMKDFSIAQVLDEYQKTYEQNMVLARQIPPELWAKVGTIPWYGDTYSLDDYVVYTFYGHKREHAAQINTFRDAHPSP